MSDSNVGLLMQFQPNMDGLSNIQNLPNMNNMPEQMPNITMNNQIEDN